MSEVVSALASPSAWSAPDPAWTTLGEMLEARAARTPDRKAFEFLQPGRAPPQSITYSALHGQAGQIAGRLRSEVAIGENALLIHPPGLEFIAAFFGCLYAGVRPIPVALSLLPDGLQKIATIRRASAAGAILANTAHLSRLKRALPQPTGPAAVRHIATDDLGAAKRAERNGSPDSAVAFLQYSSGSTGDPKGVVISHSNVMHNLALQYSTFRLGPQDLAVSWLPHHHDMGLVAGILHSLYAGIPAVLMSPLAFLLKPVEWLTAISRYRATLSAAPNFAYDHCTRRIPQADRSGLDLTSWAVAVCGAEPVRAETLSRFASAFGPHGFNRRAFLPSYGLAEATLLVSAGARGDGPVSHRLDAAALEANRVVEAAPEASDGATRTIVGCGRPRTPVVIVDPLSMTPCGPDHVGEIWVAGPGVSEGYQNGPVVERNAFRMTLREHPDAQFLRTGDLGFLRDDQLCVVGRHSDLIIVRGRNLHPQDIEKTIEGSHSVFHAMQGAAFAIESDAGEEVAVVQEFEADPDATPDLDTLAAALRDAVRAEHNVEIAELALVRRGQVPKTTSGKPQRQRCKALYLTGRLNVVRAWRA